MRFFHVTSAVNRSSIARHGLDWTRMGAARGIAGSRRPEAEGVFLCRDRSEADWFLTFDNGDGPFDVWVVEGVDESELQDNGAGYQYLPGLVTADRVTLVDRDLTSRRLEPTDDQGGAYRSSLTISLPDGTVFQGDEAKAWLALQTGRTAAGE